MKLFKKIILILSTTTMIHTGSVYATTGYHEYNNGAMRCIVLKTSKDYNSTSQSRSISCVDARVAPLLKRMLDLQRLTVKKLDLLLKK